MAFADRAALLAYCQAESHRDDLESDLPNFLALAEGDINTALRQRPMLQRWTDTIEDEFVAVPPDFAGARSMRLTTGTKRQLDFLTPDQMQSVKSASPTRSGEPVAYSVIGDSFEFFPVPDDGYGVAFTGYRKVPSLASDASSNWLLTAMPNIYVAGVMRYVARREQDADQAQRRDTDFAASIALLERIDAQESQADHLTPLPSGAAV